MVRVIIKSSEHLLYGTVNHPDSCVNWPFLLESKLVRNFVVFMTHNVKLH